jgi:hypothetical protein
MAKIHHLHLRIEDEITYEDLAVLLNGLDRMHKRFDFVIDDTIHIAQ